MAKTSLTAVPATLRPLGDRLLVERIEEKEQMRGGLIIPDSAREKPQEAEVIALGRGPKAKDGTILPFELKVGDRVLVANFSGAEVKRDGRNYTFVREEDVLGLLI